MNDTEQRLDGEPTKAEYRAIIADLRLRLEAAEKVVEAARARHKHHFVFDGRIPAGPGPEDCPDEVCAALDALPVTQRRNYDCGCGCHFTGLAFHAKGNPAECCDKPNTMWPALTVTQEPPK